MSTDPKRGILKLPEHPNLRHLKDQAKQMLKAGAADSLTHSQFKIAQQYGFASWPKLKTHVELFEEIGQLKEAIDTNDLERVKMLMGRNPALHQTPVGPRPRGHWPLTWVAECRVPPGAPTAARLAIAEWMIANGSDVHQNHEAPLARAALSDLRIAMMELLVVHGANVNARTKDGTPIIFYACDTLAPVSLKWLINHGADPNVGSFDSKSPGGALDYLIGAYQRSSNLGACIEILLNAGATMRHDVPALLDILRGRLDLLTQHLDADPGLLHRRFPECNFGGGTGTRRLTLQGATLLHVAAEYGNVDAARLLLDRGADVNGPAMIDADGIGGQTPIFHAVTQFNDWGLAVAELLIQRGADLSLQAKLPGHYERPDEFVTCTPLGYARQFPAGAAASKTVLMLQEKGAIG